MDSHNSIRASVNYLRENFVSDTKICKSINKKVDLLLCIYSKT